MCWTKSLFLLCLCSRWSPSPWLGFSRPLVALDWSWGGQDEYSLTAQRKYFLFTELATLQVNWPWKRNLAKMLDAVKFRSSCSSKYSTECINLSTGSTQCTHQLAVRHQVVLDASLGAPVFGELVLCYLLQVEHCHLSWLPPHSATGSPFKVLLLALSLCRFLFLLRSLLFQLLLFGLAGRCFFLPIPPLRWVLLLVLASWCRLLRDSLKKQQEILLSKKEMTVNVLWVKPRTT